MRRGFTNRRRPKCNGNILLTGTLVLVMVEVTTAGMNGASSAVTRATWNLPPC